MNSIAKYRKKSYPFFMYENNKIIILLITIFSFYAQDVDTIKRFQMFHNINTPVPILEEMTCINEGDLFDLRGAKRQRFRYYETGYYDDVTMLFFKKKEGIHLQYYFKERTIFFDYFAYPIITLKNEFGVGGSAYWDHIFNTTTDIQFDLNYFKKDQLYRLIIKDKFWHPKMYYRYFIGWKQESYKFRDLKKSDRYIRFGLSSGIEAGYRFEPEEKFLFGFEQSRFELNNGIYQNKFEEKLSRFYIRYEKNSFDWDLLPSTGYKYTAKLSYVTNKEGKHFRFAEFSAEYVYKLHGKLQQSLAVFGGHSSDILPHYLKYHLDSSTERLNTYSPHLISRSFVLLKNKIQFLAFAKYDPFHDNSYMFAFGLNASAGKFLKESAYVDYWQIGLSGIFFWLKNKVEISINRDRFEKYFLQIKTSAW